MRVAKPVQGGPPREPEETALDLVDACMNAANRLRASDIHVEIQDEKLVFRMRVDGRLRQWRDAPLRMHPPVMARLKILAQLRWESGDKQEARLALERALELDDSDTALWERSMELAQEEERHEDVRTLMSVKYGPQVA